MQCAGTAKGATVGDIVDQAYEQNLAAFEAEQRSKRKPVGPPANGYCHNCGVSLPPGVRYCDHDCMVDHQHRLASAKRNGREYND